MSEEIIPKPAPKSPEQTRGFRIGALIVLAVAGALIVWLALRHTGGSSHPSNVTAASAGQIRTLAASVDHPVYWVGRKQGFTYEVTQQSNGAIIIRYLPQGAKVGSSTPYLSVATYPFNNAYAALQGVAQQKGVRSVSVPGGGIGTIAKRYPADVHVAYPAVDYQVEIFDPAPGTAKSLVVGGQLVAVGHRKQGPGVVTKPAVATLTRLRSVPRTVGHPVYWLGPKPRSTYELTLAGSGKVIIRYLPQGTKAGSANPYTAVATYSYPGAFGAIKRLSKQPNVVALSLPGGGLGVISKGNRKSIHLAYPGSAYEVEVFDPSPARVRSLVTSGQVTTVH
jgi:hypothetical protein